jgi:hypothetical protein
MALKLQYDQRSEGQWAVLEDEALLGSLVNHFGAWYYVEGRDYGPNDLDQVMSLVGLKFLDAQNFEEAKAGVEKHITDARNDPRLHR